MSSAALQAAPHQPTSVSSHSSIAATSSNRPYTAGSSQSREQQYYNQNPPNASPSSTRRPSRRTSSNGANSGNNSQQGQYYSPSGNTSSSAPVNPRGQSSSNHASSSNASNLPSAGYPTMAPGDPQTGRAPVVSPRTSSNRNSASHVAASAAERTSRRAGYNESTNSPRAAQGDGSQDRVDRQRSNGNTQINGADRGGDDAVAIAAANAAARSRRRQQPSGETVLPHRPSGSRETRAPQSSSAARAAAASTRSDTLPRENSQILNVVKVSDPEQDLVREEERKAEAVPSSPTTQAPMGVVSNEGNPDVPRSGGRSRHDHGASAKREKSSKFGDYFLGSTLGEGEFGKVKMGWKQEGGVQASCYGLVNGLQLTLFRWLSSSFAATVSAQTLRDLQRSTVKLPSSAK